MDATWSAAQNGCFLNVSTEETKKYGHVSGCHSHSYYSKAELLEPPALKPNGGTNDMDSAYNTRFSNVRQNGLPSPVVGVQLSIICNMETRRTSDSIYPDPLLGAPASFQQRLMELASLEADTIRWERLRKVKKKSQN